MMTSHTNHTMHNEMIYKRVIILFLIPFLCIACNKQKPSERARLHFQQGISENQESVIYCHSEAPIVTVTLTEDGYRYDINAFGGQIMLFFKDYVSHENAVKIVENHRADIIAQIPYLKYYLIEVPIGNEGTFVSLLQNEFDIDFVYPNIVGEFCATMPYVVDNFNGDHGEKVAAMITSCDPLMNIIVHNVSPYDNAEGINTNKAIEAVEKTLKNLNQEDGAVFNMSFGPGLVRFWSIIPWQNRVLWSDRYVTDDNKISYRKRYINDLKTWIKLTTKYDDKDFVIVKSSGNAGMKELETIISDLTNELSTKELGVFERHFILVSANDDNQELDYPNDVSSYNKMVTKVDISDMTAQDLHWQGTSFSSPRVAGYITTASNDYKMKVVDVLKHVRNATQKANKHILTYELMEREINNADIDSNNDNDDYNSYNTERIAEDLVGQVVYEPSTDGYFSQEWHWEIEKGEVLGIEGIKRERDIYGHEDVTIIAHLHRGELKIDAEMVLKYVINGTDKTLLSSIVNKLIIPTQTDYSQYVEIKMDYDFFPSLVVYNNSNMILFVGGDYSTDDEYKRFASLVEPHSSEMIGIGCPKSYHVHFAYRK